MHFEEDAEKKLKILSFFRFLLLDISKKVLKSYHKNYTYI